MDVAIFGGGYAGLTLASELEDRLAADHDLVLVDETGEHVLRHELHRLVRRPALEDELAIPLSELLERTDVRVDSVTDVDPAGGAARLAEGGTLEYDLGAVCLGGAVATHDVDGVAEHAVTCHRLADGPLVREGALAAIEAGRPIAVCGAGLTGIQVAGELAALSDEEGGDAIVVLLEREDAVAPAFPADFRSAVREALEDRDVTVRTGARVEELVDGGVALADGETLETGLTVWAGGITGGPGLGGQRPTVRATLRYEDGTFVLGDAARVVDAEGTAVPASAQAAIREARVAAANLAALADGADASGFEPRLQQYRFEEPGWLVSVGDGAVAKVGPSILTGRAARALKTSVGAGYLSSVGAVGEALDLVRAELPGWGDEAAQSDS